jgi:cyanophycinase-like exopeptidase
MAAQIDNSDVVYLTGGDPSHLVNVMTGSLFLETIRTHAAKDLVLAGSSAGAMAMGSEMRYRNESNAFGIVSNTIIIPHHENRNPEETCGQVKELTKRGITIFGIDTSTGVVSDNITLSVHGTGRVVVYNSEGWKEYLTGQIIFNYS